MLFPDYSFCFFEINTWPLPPKNFTILTQKIKAVEEWKDTRVNQLSILGWDSRFSRRLKFPYHFKTNAMLFPHKSFSFFEINAWPLLPKNFTILTQKIKPVEEWKDTGLYCQYHRLGFWISRRLTFPYHFKTNGMLSSDKSFSVFEINGLPLPPKIFTIRTQKIKPLEEWKVARVNRQYYAGILGYREDQYFRVILKRTECFSLTNLLGFLR